MFITPNFGSHLSNLDPCDPANVVFECKKPSISAAFFFKILTTLPFTYAIAHFINKHKKGQLKLLKIELSFCINILAYLVFYYAIENFTLYGSLQDRNDQMHRLRQIPLNLWFLCQVSYMTEIVHVISFLGYKRVRILEIATSILKYICALLLVFSAIVYCIPTERFVNFFNNFNDHALIVNDIFFYIFHSLVIIVLSIVFIFSESAYNVFPLKFKTHMYFITFAYCIALLFDSFAFEWGHSIHFYVKLFYTKRDRYLYIDYFLKFFYYDLPPLILLYLFFLLASPDAPDTEERDVLSQKISQLSI